MGKRIILLGILAICFQFFGFGQELKYIFDKGQVLQYEHVTEREDNWLGLERIQEKIQALEIEITGISRNKYSMSLKVVSAYKKTHNKNDFSAGNNTYETAFDTTAVTLINYADQGKRIDFEMDAWGKILEVKGVSKFQNDVAWKIHNEGRKGYKSLVNYGYLTSRISSEYYRVLINDIFPDISGLKDTISTFRESWEMDGSECYSTHNWLPQGRKSNLYYFNNNYFVSTMQDRDSVFAYLKNQKGYFEWNTTENCIQKMEYPRNDILTMLADGWSENQRILIHHRILNPTEIRYRSKVKVKKLGEYMLRNKPAYIIGDIIGCDSCKIVVNLPTKELTPDTRVFTVDGQGQSLNFSGDLPFGPDMLTIYFPENYKTFLSYESDPRQIRIFVRPGDTVRFSVDLRNFGKDIAYFGPTWKEQKLINSYILGYANLYPKITLQDIINTQQQFENNKSEYCQEFQDWFQFESLYEEMEYRLNEIRGPNVDPISFSVEDSLGSFSKYLNNYQGYKSAAYKRFIKRMVLTYSSTAKYNGLSMDPYAKMMESVGIVLSGWDKYYVLADLTEARIHNFYSPVSQSYYKYFNREYKGSEYANYLKKIWDRHRRIMPGEKFPDFEFTDIHGKNHSIREFKGKVLTLATMNSLPKKRKVTPKKLQRISSPKFADSIRQKQYEEFLIKRQQQDSIQKIIMEEIRQKKKNSQDYMSIYFISGDDIPSSSQLDSLNWEKVIFVTSKKATEKYFSILGNRTDLTLTLDRDQQIARINKWPAISNMHYNLRSWPQLEEVIEAPKTINRRTLWLILSVILITVVFIFLKVRDRNRKREAQHAQKRKMAELELGAVRSRMNPHFLFNSLSSIQNLVNGDEIEKANLYLADFGDLVRKILDQSSKNQITLEEELATLKTYLELENLRFAFKYSIIVAEDIQAQEIEIPPLFIQPHVENAIIHGLSGMSGAGELKIEFSRVGNNLEVLVEDNGPGLVKKTKSNGLGKGWELTNQRVQLLKDQWGQNISVRRLSNDDKSGMRVKFVIPLETKQA